MSGSEEHVLVIPAAVIDQIGQIDQFEADADRFLNPILQSDQLSYKPRSAMEVDPQFKQLIPYVVLQCVTPDGKLAVFTYTRGGGGGETRLHAKRSVGIGGHISLDDASSDANDHHDAYQKGMARELEEEIVLDTAYEQAVEGLIYDDSNEVGKVHLGVLHRFFLDAPNVSSNEDDLAEGGFLTVDELRSDFDRLETWSQIAIKALYGDN
ncbi:hypothetical protein SV7mr_20470 [Stieleria bergensis]|uniref:Nudix hydrolase domain-containing protein n=1 Tax=Stieleria bergensis TaxID=2528025 RepID=A0A517STR7_9BACT|nr:hypothetical protein SV7mr_20470 [Planctomycetes bacterium SV_7m_r]